MRVSLTTKQTLGVTALIALSMTALSALHLASLARMGLEASRANGEMLARAIYQRAREAVASAPDPQAAIRSDPGIRSILESTIAYSPSFTYAAIVSPGNIVIAHSFTGLEGELLDPQQSLAGVLGQGPVDQVRAIYADRTLEITEPLQLGTTPFGAIRIGLSPVLIRNDLSRALAPMLWMTLAVLGVSTLVALILARRVLRPIHVISSGLTRLGRGETDVTIDLSAEEELKDLSQSFNAISRQLADRAQGTPRQSAIDYSRKLASLSRLLAGVAHEVKNPLNAMTIHLELVREHLNAASEALHTKPGAGDDMHARVGAVLGISAMRSPAEIHRAMALSAPLHTGEPLTDAAGQAEMSRRALDDAREHVDVIGDEIKRLDEVIQAFLRFMRPQELRLEPVSVSSLIRDVLALVEPEIHRAGIVCRVECASSLPDLQADAALIRQALLNLALNACQAMPDGGTLVIGARAKGGRVILEVEDSGTGIAPDQLEKIFDLYYTTKPGGSGIGLSMVFRTVQLHGGEVEVESTLERGTRFRLLLPQP